MSEPSGVYHAGTVWVCQGSLSLSGTSGDYQGHCGSVRYIAGL